MKEYVVLLVLRPSLRSTTCYLDLAPFNQLASRHLREANARQRTSSFSKVDSVTILSPWWVRFVGSLLIGSGDHALRSKTVKGDRRRRSILRILRDIPEND